MPEHRKLFELVQCTNEKITAKKDPNKPYVGLEHIPQRGSEITEHSNAGDSISTNSVFQESDVLFGKLRPNLRKCVLAKFAGYCSTDILVLRALPGTSPSFAVRILQSEQLGAEAEKSAIGTKMPRTSWASLRNIKVFAPAISEQKKIAQILDTLDTQIQKTEALIAKLEKIKEGLLHDLLTRGIDQNGQLRPTPEQAPELYKESALGLIPRDWEAVKLGAVARITHGYAFSGAEFTDKPIGPILLTPGNFHRDGGMYFTEGNTKRYLGKVPPGYTLVQGDIVTVMTDLSPQTLILGMTAVVQEGGELLHNQRIGKILFVNPEQWCSRFISAQMSSLMFRRKVVAKATGTTVRHSSPEKILSEYVVVPKPKEQQEISRIITSYERQILDEKRSSKKLTAQKQGLMNDLLTGQVRVTPLLKDAV